jgi:hypothetical protein
MSDITTTPDMLPITPPTMAPIGMSLVLLLLSFADDGVVVSCIDGVGDAVVTNNFAKDESAHIAG